MSHVIGFTGTRKGMSDGQVVAFRKLLASLVGVSALHHGDCVGADAEAHNLFRRAFPTTPIIVHPPEDSVQRAYCAGKGVMVVPERPFLNRNRDIVDACTILFAAPSGPEEQRSGTWATIRYARGLRRAAVIILPNGSRA